MAYCSKYLIFLRVSFIIFVLVLLSLPVISLWHIRHEIKAIKMQMKSQIIHAMDKDVIRFQYSEEEIASSQSVDYLVEENELEIDGKMYDIKSVDIQDDYYTFHCISDEKETLLKRELKTMLYGLFSRNHPLKNETKKLLLFFQNLILSDIPRLLLWNIESYIISYSHCYQEQWESKYLEVVSPPPQI